MAPWTAFPYDETAYIYTPEALAQHWGRLHAGDAEPWPEDPAAQAAWALFHAGDFQAAVQAGQKAGGSGMNAANKAQLVYAHYLEPHQGQRFALYQEVLLRTSGQLALNPTDANAHYLRALALMRGGQVLNVAKSLALGLGLQEKLALEAALALQPLHAEAHTALGCFHAQTIDAMGALLGRVQGADLLTGMKHFREALRLHPQSAAARVEYAKGLLMLEGDKRLAEAERLYAEAAACVATDAAERLDLEMAKAEMRD